MITPKVEPPPYIRGELVSSYTSESTRDAYTSCCPEEILVVALIESRDIYLLGGVATSSSRTWSAARPYVELKRLWPPTVRWPLVLAVFPVPPTTVRLYGACQGVINLGHLLTTLDGYSVFECDVADFRRERVVDCDPLQVVRPYRQGVGSIRPADVIMSAGLNNKADMVPFGCPKWSVARFIYIKP